MTDMKRLEAAADKIEIYDVLVRYCRGVDRLDEELIASVYHDDAYDNHGSFNGLGKDFAKGVVKRLAEAVDAGQHRIGNVYIELDGDVAWSEAGFLAVHDHGDRQDTILGRYIDRFERRNGEWKIADRTVLMDITRSTHVTERFEGEKHFLKGARDKSDWSYNRKPTRHPSVL